VEENGGTEHAQFERTGDARPCVAGRSFPAVPGRKSLRKKGNWIVLIYDLDTEYTTKSKIRALKLV